MENCDKGGMGFSGFNPMVNQIKKLKLNSNKFFNETNIKSDFKLD